MEASNINLQQLRKEYHKTICQRLLGYQTTGIPNIADPRSKISIQIAHSILVRMGFPLCSKLPEEQLVHRLFESLTLDYLQRVFLSIQHLRPGKWIFSTYNDAPTFDEYEYMSDLAGTLEQDYDSLAILRDHFVIPGILIGRSPVSDQQINQDAEILLGHTATLTPLRAANSPEPRPILHASISCKWTIRSDRSQNARTEGLNLIRNRKGNTPHIAIVTAEPMPGRIASVALGTGDLDCVYHMALYELGESIEALGDETSSEMFNLLVNGKRLRDISDLPFDLAI
ncbi:MAG: NgoMIV family type II restriction endonuclease [Anaerolineae bacterium]